MNPHVKFSLTSKFDMFIMPGFPSCFGVCRSGGKSWQDAGLDGKRNAGVDSDGDCCRIPASNDAALRQR